MKLRSLHRGHIKELLRAKHNQGLSKNSVRLIRATLSVMLGDAVDEGVITSNPAQGIARRGRRQSDTLTTAERQRKIRPLSHEQLRVLFRVAEQRCPHRDCTMLLLLADSGVRPGEALALKWEDFDQAD